MECLFCKITAGEIQSEIVYEDDTVVAFEDISPQAPVHILVVPKKHISTLDDLTDEDSSLAGELLIVAKELAKEKGVTDKGYRIVLNCNRGAGQTVFHIHAHLLGGREFGWPPG
ncbi:MAG: histidine triad nucleotide-binding protein [Candidatus Glassbacteria bacterium]